jgi:hypothetical protein
MTHKAAPILPPLPPQRSLPTAPAWTIFSRQQFADLGHQFADLAARQQSQYDAAELTLQLLGTFTSALEGLMASVAELQAALDANTAANAAARVAIDTEVAQLAAAIAALAAAAPADLQPQVDQVNAATASLQAAVAALAADDPAPPAP